MVIVAPGGADLKRSEWVRVSRARPCPVCKKHDWCMVLADDSAAICARTESGKRCGEAGWLHRLGQDAAQRNHTACIPNAPNQWAANVAKYAGNLTADLCDQLAEQLGLPADAVRSIPGLGWRQSDRGGPCFTFPESDAAGAVIGIMRRYADGSKKAMRGSHRGLTLPEGWADRTGPIAVVEGPTCAAASVAAGLAGIGRPSCNGGVDHLTALLAEVPTDRPILVVGENDEKQNGAWPGRDGAELVARSLSAALRRPVLWSLPPPEAKDVREWLTSEARKQTPWLERGRELLAHLTAAATTDRSFEAALAPPAGRPRIVIETAEYLVNAAAAEALGREPDLFARGGMLVQVAKAPTDPDPAAPIRRPPGVPVVRDVPPALLRERLTRCAEWVCLKQRGGEIRETPAHPPAWSVQAVYERGDWQDVRRLEAVVTHPALLPDGSVLSAAGYDPGSGLLVWLPPGLKVDVSGPCDRTAVAAAVAGLLDVVNDFPFESSAHLAAWLAGLLTPLAWFAFDGPAPLFLIDKNVRGAGAGLLADVIALILTGRRFPAMTYTSDREELRKKITSLAVEGERLVLLDNLAGAVGCDVLDTALTTDRWKDRLLGGNRVYDGPLHICWYATGNNVQLQADTARRVCHVRMETTEERPELRTGFNYPNLRQYVRANRGRLLSAAMTILRGWVATGRPQHGLPPWGSFEGWSGVVREAVVFCGLPDPGETRLALQTAADREAAAMTGLLGALEKLDPTRRGLTTAEIINRIGEEPDPRPDWYLDLRAAVEDLCGKLDGRALGYRFRHFARRNFAGRMLDKSDAPHGANRWVVLHVRPAGAGADRRRHRHHPEPDVWPGGDGGHGGNHPPATDPPGPQRSLFEHQRFPD